MSNSGNNSFNKNVALIGGIIGIVVSCITIFTFVTGITTLRIFRNNEKPENNAQLSVQATEIPENPQTNLEEYENITPEQLSTSTPVGIQNPTGIIEAGKSIYVDGLTLVVKPEYEVESINDLPLISIEMIVRNDTDSNKLFSYERPSAITLKDNVGNIYNPLEIGNDFYAFHQFTIEDRDQIEFRTGSYWNPSNAYYIIPYFYGPISTNATQLIIEFDNFGPFTNFSVSIDI